MNAQAPTWFHRNPISAGAAGRSRLFALLYQYAFSKRAALELNEYEIVCTRNAIVHFSAFASVGVIVSIAALTFRAEYVGYAGFLFCLNAVWGWIAGSVMGKQQRMVLERMKAESATQL